MSATTMQAVCFNQDENLHIQHLPIPKRNTGECLIKITTAGICNTDLEIIKGYMGFHGILGHEFIGKVIEADSSNLIGKRVVGEICLGCGTCQWCKRGRKEHCPNRSVLGIDKKDGCFAEYITLPESNCIIVPDSISDQQAVFIEPLAAALRIVQQIQFNPENRVAVLGDGKLGLLIAMVFTAMGTMPVTLFGHHSDKMNIVESPLLTKRISVDDCDCQQFDYIIEATGSKSGFSDALNLVKPEGTIVLKSTISDLSNFNLAPIVINEISIVGSRCGHFQPAVNFLQSHHLPLEKMITSTYPIEKWREAFKCAKDHASMKILISL